ncbi:MAG: MFS transporter, partial [Deltaproteobacteria bacterium]
MTARYRVGSGTTAHWSRRLRGAGRNGGRTCGTVASCPPAPLTAYQRRLLVFLSVATFFEGFDFLAMSQILPELRHTFGLTRSQGGLLVGVVNVGTVLAWLIVRLADRIGRRPVLTLTIVGYTLFSMLSGFAPNVQVFAGAQLLARMFLLGEWAVAMVFAAEEYPAERRATVIGTIQAFSAIGSIACAVTVPR